MIPPTVLAQVEVVFLRFHYRAPFAWSLLVEVALEPQVLIVAYMVLPPQAQAVLVEEQLEWQELTPFALVDMAAHLLVAAVARKAQVECGGQRPLSQEAVQARTEE
jgi:hypothetical protein